ncbi:MAG: C45 family peptidase [Chloroflexota bacterium]
MTGKIKLVEISGSPYEMGYTHGKRYPDEIRHFAEDRVALSSGDAWTGRSLSRDEVLALGEACLAEHQTYSPDLYAELQGMSDATGVSLRELVIVSGFTDFIDVVYNATVQEPKVDQQPYDNCTAFIVPDQQALGEQGFFGQTWDMHDTATPYVILLRCKPDNGPASLVFTTIGCVGMIGMNEAGIAIGINNLLGADGQVGVTWPFVIRKALMQTDIEAALACITETKLAGAHNYLLFDKAGRGYNIEAMSTYHHVTSLNGEAIAHTNHCLMPEAIARSRPRVAKSQAHSEARLHQACQLLGRSKVTPEDLMALTQASEICTISKPPMHVETCGAAIMRPKTGDFWAVWGLPTENNYEHFVI